MSKLVYATLLQKTKEIRQMATTKALLALFTWLSIPLLGISWLANLDNIKSTIIFIVSLSMALTTFAFKVLAWIDNRKMRAIKRRMEEIELRNQELALIEREKRLKKQ